MYETFDECVYHSRKEAEQALIREYLIPRYFDDYVQNERGDIHPYAFTCASESVDVEEFDALIISLLKLRYDSVDSWDINSAVENYEFIMNAIEDESSDDSQD